MADNTQQGDVRLFQTLEGGDMEVDGGIAAMSGGLETAAYLSLFGGNFDDSGAKDDRKTWWANLDEIDPARAYRSETGFLLDGLPSTSGNLRRIEDAARRDLAWFVEEGAASFVDVQARMPAPKKIDIQVRIEAFGTEADFIFSANWISDAQIFTPSLPLGTVSTLQGFALLESGGFALLESGDLAELEG